MLNLLETRFQKDTILETKYLKHKFDYSWRFTDTTKYLKPISFDLSSETDINTKVAQQVGYLTDLYNFGEKGAEFDFIIAKPQKKELNGVFQNALDFIESVKIKKKLVLENQINSYSQEIISDLHTLS